MQQFKAVLWPALFQQGIQVFPRLPRGPKCMHVGKHMCVSSSCNRGRVETAPLVSLCPRVLLNRGLILPAEAAVLGPAT